MTADRTALLTLLSNLDQSMARIEVMVEHAQTFDGWQTALDAHAYLKNQELQVQAALRQTVQ